jgi:putative ATP-dependent endonuclease of the OLD family
VLCEPLAVVIGEYNAGKSNLIDALRLLFEPEAGPRAGGPPSRTLATPAPDCQESALEAELCGLTDDDSVRVVTCLAPSLGANA